MIKSRSPHYKEIPYDSPSSGTTPDLFYLDIYVWDGVKGTPPTEATYREVKRNPLAFSGNAKMNISGFVNDYFANSIPSLGTSTEIVDGVSVWVKTEVIYLINDVEQSPEFVVTELAIYGYGLGYEGENTTTPTNGILTQGNDVRVSNNSVFALPFLASESDSIEFDINGTILTQNAITTPLAKVLYIDVSDYSDEIIDIKKDGVLVYSVVVQEEPRYTPLDIAYVNKEGQLSTFTMFKEKVDRIVIKGEDYESSIGQPLDGYHQFVDFNKNAKESFTMNSGFLDEDNNVLITQLLLSESVWQVVDNNLKPLNIKSSSLEYKTRQKDRLINYKINFDYSYNTINNI